jgi:hypothetical protein
MTLSLGRESVLYKIVPFVLLHSLQHLRHLHPFHKIPQVCWGCALPFVFRPALSLAMHIAILFLVARTHHLCILLPTCLARVWIRLDECTGLRVQEPHCIPDADVLFQCHVACKHRFQFLQLFRSLVARRS